MAEDVTGEPLFRTTKRRKIVRRRAEHDSTDEDGLIGQLETEQSEAPITKHLHDNNALEEHGAGGVTRAKGNRGVRRQGIGFSSAGSRRHTEQDHEEMALVRVAGNEVSEVMQSDRFVKPTGRVGLSENKHMTAYVDSKLAELRSSAAVVPAESNSEKDLPNTEIDLNAEQDGPAISIDPSEQHTATRSGPRTYQQAQSRSERVYQRPTKRRPRPSRDQTDVARDSMIDLIMRENQVPLYDRSISNTPNADGTDAGDVDNDAAAAEAFKAQLLADLEAQKRRKPATASKNAATAATGPKLGGSRSQREKMRALEEAKSSNSKK